MAGKMLFAPIPPLLPSQCQKVEGKDEVTNLL